MTLKFKSPHKEIIIPKDLVSFRGRLPKSLKRKVRKISRNSRLAAVKIGRSWFVYDLDFSIINNLELLHCVLEVDAGGRAILEEYVKIKWVELARLI